MCRRGLLRANGAAFDSWDGCRSEMSQTREDIVQTTGTRQARRLWRLVSCSLTLRLLGGTACVISVELLAGFIMTGSCFGAEGIETYRSYFALPRAHSIPSTSVLQKSQMEAAQGCRFRRRSRQQSSHSTWNCSLSSCSIFGTSSKCSGTHSSALQTAAQTNRQLREYAW